MKQWPHSVNSRFAEVTKNDILRMQDITTDNDRKKAPKLGMKFSKLNNISTHNLLTCPVPSLLIDKFC